MPPTPRTTLRVATAMALALPIGLAPALASAAQPPQRAAAVPANDAPPAPKKPTKPAPTRPTVPSWRQYIAQKPRFSTKACTADVAAVLKTIKKGRPVVECVRIMTPLDWSDLRKGAMTLQISRVAHVGRAPARGLFVNPGGPGGAAGTFTAAMAVYKPMLRTTHDIIGVDPRGTGGSTPLPCVPFIDPLTDSRVATRAAQAKRQAAYRAFAQNCVARYAKVLPYITTANTVHDQDLARRVLGYPKADWYGVSGGSWMGAYYATLHPGTVGRVVVDANTDFGSDWRTSFHDLPMGFQRRYDAQFLPWAARHHRQYGLGTSAAAVRGAIESLRTAAGRGKVKNLTPDLLDLTIFLALYKDAQLPPLTKALGQAVRGLHARPRTSFSMPEGLDTTVSAAPKVPSVDMVTVRTAIICNDGPFTRTPASFEAELSGFAAASPLLGRQMGMIAAPCAYWKVPTSAKVQIAGRLTAPMLMLQNQMDPATPIEGAKRAHATVANTRMITVLGAGEHGAFPGSARNSCLEKNTLAYLQKGVFPTQDLTCTGAPLPGDAKVYSYTTG